ncbi:MAG: branched-chain amino acid ABC transporter permease [Rhodobacteraceae bacterium]|nr:branched-chain amino acid ABC transporter permease [Paracoccaceae bacterium]
MDALLSGDLLFAALMVGSVYALVALGLNLIYGTLRLLNIAHGDLIMLGAYASFWLFTLVGLSPIIGAGVAAIGCAGLGAAAYYALLRRQIEQPGPIEKLEANSLLLFFGLSVIIQNMASLAFTASPRAIAHLDQIYQIAGVSITANRLATLVIAVVICVALTAFLRLNIYGLAIKALIQNRDAAAISGVNVERVRLMSLLAGFGLAGLAGALLSMTEQISPFMGFPFTIAAFVVIILGGLGNLTGGMIAGLLLGVLETYGVALTSPSYRSILVYGVFIAVLLYRPQGLLGGKRISR